MFSLLFKELTFIFYYIFLTASDSQICKTNNRHEGDTGQVVRASDSGSGDPGSILGRVGVLFSRARDIYSPKVLVIPSNRWLRLNMTEKLFTEMLNHNQNKKQTIGIYILYNIAISSKIYETQLKCLSDSKTDNFSISDKNQHTLEEPCHEKTRFMAR